MLGFARAAAPRTEVVAGLSPLPSAPVLAMAADVEPLPNLIPEGAPPVISDVQPVVDRQTDGAAPVRVAAQGVAPESTLFVAASEAAPLIDWTGDMIRQMPQVDNAALVATEDVLPVADTRAPDAVPEEFTGLPPHHWAAVLDARFEPSEGGPGLKLLPAQEGADLPDWVGGSEAVLLAANGWRVTRREQLLAALAGVAVSARDGTGDVSLTLAGQGGADQTVTRKLTFVRTGRSPGGTEFETAFARGRWQTVVTAVSKDSDFQVGDVLVREFATKEKLDHPKDLEAALLHGQLNGLTELRFAILRGGLIDTGVLTTDGSAVTPE